LIFRLLRQMLILFDTVLSLRVRQVRFSPAHLRYRYIIFFIACFHYFFFFFFFIFLRFHFIWPTSPPAFFFFPHPLLSSLSELRMSLVCSMLVRFAFQRAMSLLMGVGISLMSPPTERHSAFPPLILANISIAFTP